MNDRTSGGTSRDPRAIVAWIMLTASVLWGIVLATDLFPKWRRNARLLAMHRWLAGLTFFFIAGHLVTLLFDSYAKFGLRDLLVPAPARGGPRRSPWASSPSGCSSPSRSPLWP